METSILGFKCKSCGHVHYPNRARCRKCHHQEFEVVPLPKNGTLLTYTHAHALPGDFEVARLTLGIVLLENGNRITGQLDIPEPRIGMKVQGRIETVRKTGYQNFKGMVFRSV